MAPPPPSCLHCAAAALPPLRPSVPILPCVRWPVLRHPKLRPLPRALPRKLGLELRPRQHLLASLGLGLRLELRPRRGRAEGSAAAAAGPAPTCRWSPPLSYSPASPAPSPAVRLIELALHLRCARPDLLFPMARSCTFVFIRLGRLMYERG